MKKWSYSIFSYRIISFIQQNRHAVGVIFANNYPEAIGICTLISYKIYPQHKGWRGHHVIVSDIDIITDPEKVGDLTDG